MFNLTLPLLVCSLLVTVPSPLLALEMVPPNLIVLTPSEVEACAGGCTLVPTAVLQEFINATADRAFLAGKRSCGTTI